MSRANWAKVFRPLIEGDEWEIFHCARASEGRSQLALTKGVLSLVQDISDCGAPRCLEFGPNAEAGAAVRRGKPHWNAAYCMSLWNFENVQARILQRIEWMDIPNSAYAPVVLQFDRKKTGYGRLISTTMKAKCWLQRIVRRTIVPQDLTLIIFCNRQF
jgi:hypothetical protein